jgi:protein-S-isoprenylcysteine O-methyltransferase Ste14
VVHVLELKIPPALLGALTVFLMWLATRWAPALTFAIPQRGWIAAGVALVGALIAVAGVISFRRAHTTVNPTKPARASSLVVSGIYNYTRNPMYLGFAVILLGLALYFSNALAVVSVPCFVLYLDCFQIRPEERALSSLFPEGFAAYKHRVRRWL